MNLTKNDIQSFAMAVFNTYDLSKIKIDKDIALKFLTDQIQSEYEELNMIETMQSRHQHFKVGHIEDYAEYIIEIEEGKKVVCGIRHFGGNPDLPFINCIPNFEIVSKHDAKVVAKRICSRFKKFNPLYLSFWSSKDIEIDLMGSVFLASQYMAISEHQIWSLDNGIKLESIHDNSYYDWYKSGYEQFHIEKPELKSSVPLTDHQTLNESFEQGLLFFAKINGEKVGLIAGVKSDFLGHSGIYFNEIFVSKDSRGKGFAKSIQRNFIIENAKVGDIIWGTIDYQNKSSFYTAAANGRLPIRYECFLRLSQGNSR
jgi:hypothetical protein